MSGLKLPLFQRKLKISTILTLLLSGSILLTTVILLTLSYQSEKESLVNTYLSLNYSKSKKVSNSVENLFKSMRMSLKETADFIANNEELSDQEVQEQLELLRKTSRYFNSLSWVDETGLVRSIAPINVGLKGKVITEGVSKEQLDLKKPLLTRPYIGNTGRLIVVMSQPIFNKNNKYKGLIGGAIYLEEKNVLNEILGNDVIDENGSYYYVVGPEGNLLFHPLQERIGENVSANDVVRKLMNGETGKIQVTNTKGIAMLAAYSVVPGINWGIVQQTPVSYLNSLLVDRIQEHILYMLKPFIILLFFTVLIAHKLTKPFVYITDLINQLSEGKPVSSQKFKSHWNREADLLTKSFNNAVEAVNKKNAHLIHEAKTDLLTGLPNRRKLNEVMEKWINEDQLFSLVVLDIDHFKAVNDVYGHQAGDEVLKYIARTVEGVISSNDICSRYGGEEFVILLPNTTIHDAYRIAEEVRTTIEKTENPIGKTLTISLGISEFPFHSSSLTELFRFADKAMYDSKLGGRNRTTIWSETNKMIEEADG
jgi:diguanylate cyclase (GGDEF)-like protein